MGEFFCPVIFGNTYASRFYPVASVFYRANNISAVPADSMIVWSFFFFCILSARAYYWNASAATLMH